MVQITKYSEKRMYTGTFNCQRMVCHIHDCVIQMLQLIYYVGEYTIQVRYVVDYIGFCKKLSLWTLNYVFGIIFFLLSACVLYGAIAYKTGLLVLAFVGNFIKDVLATIGFILILLTVGKDGRFESNGVTYELDMAALIIIGVIGK